MRGANLALRFALELGAITALVYWGIETGSNAVASIALALAAPAVFIATWGRWIAPKAGARLDDPARLGVELVLFALVIAALATAGATAVAIAFCALLTLNEALLLAWSQRGDA